MRNALIIATLAALVCGPANADEDDSFGHFGLGLNVLQLGIFAAASGSFDNSVLVPVPFEIHYQPKGIVGVAGTIQYRHHEDGSLSLNEMTLCARPRIRFIGTDLKGFYLTVKFGFGFAAGESYMSSDYKRAVFVIHPELGYAITFGSPSFFLVFGGGIQSQIPMTEIPEKIQWNSMGKLCNYYVPTLNITVGFAI